GNDGYDAHPLGRGPDGLRDRRSMNARLLRVFLLACVAYWATGLAQFAHDRLEHEGGSAAATSTSSTAAARVSVAAAPAGHSHDDCPTCLMLATMQAHREAPPAPPAFGRSLIRTVTVHDRTAPPSVYVLLPQSRGPPVVAAL